MLTTEVQFFHLEKEPEERGHSVWGWRRGRYGTRSPAPSGGGHGSLRSNGRTVFAAPCGWELGAALTVPVPVRSGRRGGI